MQNACTLQRHYALYLHTGVPVLYTLSIIHHARAVKSDLAAPLPATAVLGDFMRSPAPPSLAGD